MITNSEFVNNEAKNGGAIHFECSTFCSYQLENVTCSGNTAVEKGGCFHYADYRPELTNITYSMNEAPYGPNIASYGSGFILEGIGNKEIEASLPSG